MIGRSRWTGYALLAPALVAVGFLIMYPLYLVVATSFRQGKTLNVLRLSELPFGLANYRTMLASEATWHSVWVTIAYLIGSIGPAFLIGLGTALLLNRAFPGRRWLRSLILLPWAVPGVIVSIVFLWLLDGSFGVVNAMLRSPTSPFVPVALLDDDPRKSRLRIAGVAVRGTRRVLADVVRTERASTVLIAIPSAEGTAMAMAINEVTIVP